MNYKDLEPKDVFHWFYELNQIPRCSDNEKKVSDWLLNFAKERNLDAWQDEALNVVIHKKATKGYEDSKTVILQGHMDMVCEKTKDSSHDFTCDPIDMYVEDGFLKARGTTLGGDDGIAVAFCLAILDSDTIEHPPIEVVFTTAEETSMVGANGLKADHLSGSYLLNIDSEEEGIFLAASAGGTNMHATFKKEYEENSKDGLEIVLDGFKSGHSGMEIDKGRASAIKVMARLLNEVNCEKLRLAEISGGSKHNAIPSSARAVIAHDDVNAVKEAMEKLFEEIKSEYKVEEPNMKLTIKEAKPEKVFTKDLTNDVIRFLILVPHGVIYMSKDVPGLVATSANMAIIKEDDNEINTTISVRSSIMSTLEEICKKIELINLLCHAKTSQDQGYPAWEFDPSDTLRNTALKAYKKCSGKDAKISAIHAGLECGILKQILPHTEMISFGPNLYEVHTPNERMDIESVKRVWEFTKEFLKELK